MTRFIPFIVFLLLSVFLFKGLFLSPKEIPSTLIDKKLPHLALKRINKKTLFYADELSSNVWLLNVWASWCGACLAEQSLLMRLHQENVMVIGLSYKDTESQIKRWLHKNGSPYQDVLIDEHGRVAMDLGVYGTPETYIIDKAGYIRYKHIGVMTESIWARIARPIYVKLKQESI